MGSTSGVRIVVGWWHESPFGPFADAMVERADGHRILVAPSEQVRDLVATTYVFDETRVEPFTVSAGGAGGSSPSSIPDPATTASLDSASPKRIDPAVAPRRSANAK